MLESGYETTIVKSKRRQMNERLTNKVVAILLTGQAVASEPEVNQQLDVAI
jgi:hypothetical protein